VLLRAETARLQRKADWAGPMRLWKTLTNRQRITAVVILVLGIVTLLNQISGLYRSIPHH
jgi:hypothetical protein